MLHVEPVAILGDNYCWLLRDDATGETALVDPAEAAPALEAVRRLGGRLDWILVTHHHADHVAEIPQVKAATGARVAGNRADAHRLPPLDLALDPGDTVRVGGHAATVLDTPGHAEGHISFAFREGRALFPGDVIFAAGCGRLVEGTAEQMFRSLRQFLPLPDETRVCCGHEYTLSNLRYALHVDPDNAALRDFAREAEALRARGEPTLPTTIGLEKQINPFLRAADVAELARLRSGKDQFR